MPDKKIPPGLRPGEGWLRKADTLDDLAAQIDLDPVALRATVDRFNGFARAGVDEDFHRGASANDRYYSDPRAKPNPTLGPIETRAVLRDPDHARATSAPRPAWSPTSAGGCSTMRARPFRASTRPGTRRRR